MQPQEDREDSRHGFGVIRTLPPWPVPSGTLGLVLMKKPRALLFAPLLRITACQAGWVLPEWVKVPVIMPVAGAMAMVKLLLSGTWVTALAGLMWTVLVTGVASRPWVKLSVALAVSGADAGVQAGEDAHGRLDRGHNVLGGEEAHLDAVGPAGGIPLPVLIGAQPGSAWWRGCCRNARSRRCQTRP